MTSDEGVPSADGTMTLLIVDDDGPTRAVLREQFAADSHFRLVAEAEDGAEAVEAARRTRPDVVLMDISMPRMDGLTAAPLVHEASPGSCVVLATGIASNVERTSAFPIIEKQIRFDVFRDDLLDAVHRIKAWKST
ncbi:MAG TPA: response regulator [Acidimicrobiales bacterium]|nr:response regulator [Acidimicrobiales bacterium]